MENFGDKLIRAAIWKKSELKYKILKRKILKLSFKEIESCTTYDTAYGAYVAGCVAFRNLRQKATQAGTQPHLTCVDAPNEFQNLSRKLHNLKHKHNTTRFNLCRFNENADVIIFLL